MSVTLGIWKWMSSHGFVWIQWFSIMCLSYGTNFYSLGLILYHDDLLNVDTKYVLLWFVISYNMTLKKYDLGMYHDNVMPCNLYCGSVH